MNIYQETFGISDDWMQKSFLAAHEYLDQKAYSEAADCFLLLTTINPLMPNLWMGLGHAEKGQLHYDDALSAYAMAMLHGPGNPFPYYYSAVIHLELKNKEEAAHCLAICEEVIEENTHFAPLKQHLETLKYKVI